MVLFDKNKSFAIKATVYLFRRCVLLIFENEHYQNGT